MSQVIQTSGTTISIHALREEGDPPVPVFRLLRLLFLSTPSARRATWSRWRGCGSNGISIHALREEGDYSSLMCVSV